MNAVTHLEKVITGEVSAVTHLEKVIAGETSAVTYTEKVITGEATPITHLQRVIAGVESPVTHLEYIWAGGSPTPTEHEYTGAVPYTFTANGSPLISWRISGNTVQNGTPTPQNPVDVNGTGERTGNLFDKSASDKDTTGYIQSDGSIAFSQNYYVSGYIDISDLSNVTISGMGTGVNPAYCLYNANKQYVSGNKYNNVETITVNITTEHYIRFSYRVANENTTMLNTGSTALPYEPYGYKIPISSANTTTPVYLGEVESTRKIKKLVLTGNENIKLNGKNDTREILQAYFTLPSSGTTEATNIKCSHLDTLSSGAITFNTEGIAMRANGTDMIFGFAFANIDVTVADSTAVALTKLLAYLAAQYAAGTPVTVWYVLAEPETAVVNEPLMRIGDYADEVSNVATIPTVNGSNTIDVETAVKPSEVYIKYKGV